ncbi:MAG: ABC transporter substrate-binding protein, partial [Betaproteobacteria bacterium]
MSMVKQCVLGVLLAVVAATAGAEMAEINVAQQYGVSFLPLMLMERDKL